MFDILLIREAFRATTWHLLPAGSDCLLFAAVAAAAATAAAAVGIEA